MADSSQISFTPPQSLTSHIIPKNYSQTLDYSSTHRGPKIDVHASARKLFDEISKEEEEEESPEDFKLIPEEDTNRLMSTEVLEDSDEPLVFSSDAAEANDNINNDNNYNNIDDETDAWISCNQTEPEVYKPFSSGWYEDNYEKPSMVGAGLDNLGNTCFFNAVLQCFTHSVLLVQGLYMLMHPTPCDYSNERFCLICALREHIELSLSSTGKSISPWKFVDNLSYFSSSFKRFQQEDAHEFLQCFLDRLESSLNNLKSKDVALCSQNSNLVKQVFGGRVISKLRCCNCNHISDTYEPSVDLSLEIENANSLVTALDSFTKFEHIEDEEMKFTCDQCKQKVSVDKQLMLDQAPPICAFHLKRFKCDGSFVQKIDKHVEFPLELDLQAYCYSTQIDDVNLKYELYAVVVHAAFTSNSGHYYCYIRSTPGTWYKFDDRKVSSVSETHVLSEEAYILFYAKQGTPWFSNFMETYKPTLDSNLSNTSPKSVLENIDHTSKTLDSPSIYSHDDINSSKVHSPELDTLVPPGPINRAIKEKSPQNLKKYVSNHQLEIQKSTRVTSTSYSKTTFDTVTPLRPINHHVIKASSPLTLKEHGYNHNDKVFTPSTPPRSLKLDLSDDENSVVFAAKPAQMKSVEKQLNKRLRSLEVEDPVKREALKQCKRMPCARGNLLMAALVTPKSEGSVNKKSKKMTSPRKNISRSSERIRQHSRNLAASSGFR
ncbi:ubiquitin carboxyl-terminal hydrolase 21-like isoform X2 [Rutidosis leptorrhynchoides]|uniref:ubiquitin carboxyl-terminal hydrolase 21-like isoform X2 n=1 Tax=Rutidosis leptorrhynchoides TaxID=125765 RepID=UPI003A99A770